MASNPDTTGERSIITQPIMEAGKAPEETLVGLPTSQCHNGPEGLISDLGPGALQPVIKEKRSTIFRI